MVVEETDANDGYINRGFVSDDGGHQGAFEPRRTTRAQQQPREQTFDSADAESGKVVNNFETDTTTGTTAHQRKAGKESGGNKNFITRVIQKHFKTTSSPKSEAQINREKWLIQGCPSGPRFNRWVLLPAAVVTQFCCGSLYAWSVYNKPIDNLIYGEVTNMAPITYCIAVGMYGISAGLMGPWLEKHGPKRGCALAAVCILAGNLLTALALFLKQIWLVFLGYGLVAGFGIGVGNISPVAPLQQWFPDKRGLASGFAVCGFGIGAAAAAKLQILLIDYVGLPYTFIILGSSYFVLLMFTALIVRTPPNYGTVAPAPPPSDAVVGNSNSESATAPTKPLSVTKSLMSTTYRLMYLMFLAKALTGSVLISRLSNLITDIFEKTPEEASTAVSISVAFILIGDLSMPLLSDHIGRKHCFIFMLTADLVVLSLFTTITNTQTYWAILLGMFTVINCHGGGFSVTPAFLTDVFGSSNTGTCYGILLTASSIAGIGGGLVFTAIFDHFESGLSPNNPYPYNINTWWMIGVVIMGWICALVIAPTEGDLKFNRRLKSLFGCCCRKD